jgi:hypothetical protein
MVVEQLRPYIQLECRPVGNPYVVDAHPNHLASKFLLVQDVHQK